MSNKAPTLKEIARQLNLSISTVSRALGDHPSIGLRTRERVQTLARELGYQPNQLAVSLKQGKLYTIGLLLPNLREEFFSQAISAVEDLARLKGYNVLIGQSHDDPDRERDITAAMKRHRVDGLIVSMAKHTRLYDHFAALQQQGTPVVFFDRVPATEGFHKVNADMYGGTREAIEWLFKRGHRRIALLNGPREMVSSRERLDMYKQAMERRRLKIDMQLVTATDLTREGTFAAMEELTANKRKPTAILITNDYVAMDAMLWARQRQIRLNEELVFVSYANLPITNYLENRPAASVEQFPYRQAEKATEILFDLMNDSNEGETAVSFRHEIIPCELAVHEG